MLYLDISKINKQGYGLARKEQGNVVCVMTRSREPNPAKGRVNFEDV